MKAFLSHSSKDKYFVDQVARALGKTQIEYDAQTFEFTLNTQAIRNALTRADIFILFLSKNSIHSNFVREEERAALEARAKGIIKRCVVFTIDGTSYRELPEWLKEINIVQNLSSPKACARRIESYLVALASEEAKASDLYIGRESELKDLRSALAVPRSSTPLAIHLVGHEGIGRRTFLRNSLSNLYARVYDVFPEVSVGQYEGINEFYKNIYALNAITNNSETIKNFTDFVRKQESEKISIIVETISAMIENGEFVVISDDGGFYTDEGDYQPYFSEILQRLGELGYPCVGVIQTRMMPFALRQKYPKSYHARLNSLSDESVKEIISFSLKRKDIDFNESQIKQLSELVDGHPRNIKFAIKYIETYGIGTILSDPSELIAWKRKRAEDFLFRINFSEMQCDVLAALYEYRFIASDLLFTIIKGDSADIAHNIRALEDFCCIDRRDDFYHISLPLRDAIAKDQRFSRTDDWKQQIGSSICEAIRDYRDEDFVGIAILETATIAAAKGADAPAYLANLILPSHLLRIGRDYYDKKRWKSCIEFCDKAWLSRTQLPKDAQIELLRLKGLSAARLADTLSFDAALSDLLEYNSKSSKRIKHFLQGFNLRMKGNLDKAEEEFLAAYRLAPRNASTNRELASLYCKLKSYVEAESYARSAYNDSPTNPFIIDVFVQALLGKKHLGLQVDPKELAAVLDDLRRYGDAPGSSFFLIREGQRRAHERDYTGALSMLDKAIDRTPILASPYFIRADIRLEMNDITGAERDLAEINDLLAQAGGFVREEEAHAHELEIRILIEKNQFRIAKEKTEKSAFLSGRQTRDLLSRIARAVGFSPELASEEMKKWAKTYSINTPDRKQKRRR